MTALALDIGGTKLAVGLVSREGELLASARCPARSDEGPEAMIRRLVQLARSLSGEFDVVGAGCGGPLDPRRGVILCPPNLPGWKDVPLGSLLAKEFGRPVHIDNDANAAALAELHFGAGRGCRNLVYFTLSTGVGGGVILDGSLYQGTNGNAAELGHLIVDYRGRPCGCGGRGCLEAYCSGTSIAARAREQLRAGATSLAVELTGDVEKVTTHELIEAVRRGDAFAVSLWDETMDLLAAGVASAINAFNPERVVLGGGLTNAGELLFGPLRQKALSRAMPVLARVASIHPAALGADVGIVGAAAVAFFAGSVRT